MSFRLKAFLVHICSSAAALGLLLGALYLGWYHWPGWYLTGVVTVVAILIGVDVTVGPLFTLLIANPKKPRRELMRDLAVIVTVQLIALVYGVSSLWIGRPLYYVFWVNGMKVISASEVPASEAAHARQQNPELAPHWYSTPRWVWAPVSTEGSETPASHGALERGASMQADMRALQSAVLKPEAFKPLVQAGDELRARLRSVDQISVFSPGERQVLRERLAERGLRADAADAIFLAGYGRPLLAVFDPATLAIRALIPAT